MKGRIAAWALVTLPALAGTTWAQDPAAGTEEKKGSTKTVKKEDVKTWTMTVHGKEWSVRPVAPAYEGDTGLFRLSPAYTLPRRAFSFSLFRDNYDRDPKGIDFSIHGLSFGYGATDRLEIFGNLGFQNRVKANYLFQSGFWNDTPFINDSWQTGFGDIKIGAKYKILDDYLGDPVGLALKGKIKLPSADEQKGLGTGATSFGADLILSKTINYALDLHGSIGYEFTGDPDGADIGGALKWGVGLNGPPPSPARPPRPPGRARDLVREGLVRPACVLLRLQLRRPWRRRLHSQEVRPADLDRLPPRDALLRGLRAAPAASAARQPAPHGVPRLRAGRPAP